MKSRRFKKSRTAARKCNGSKKRGGMLRRTAKIAFDRIVGKGPDKLDKAKQVADAVLKGLTTQSQSTPVTPGTARTFSTPTIDRLRIDDFRTITSPIENPNQNQNLYKTPVKGKHSSGSDDDGDNNLNPYRINRHYSRLGDTRSYAPTIYETRPVVRGNLFQELTD
jgi:hypothetical protein